MIRAVTTFGYVGLMRPAPGTWGSAAAVVAGMVIWRFLGFTGLALALLAVTALGFWACAQALRDRPGDDPGEIVIDEVAGQWLALAVPGALFWWVAPDALLPWPLWLSAFVLFRLFDIWKPGPVGRADRRADPAGVMLDDLWAGGLAGVSVIFLGVLWHLMIAWTG